MARILVVDDDPSYRKYLSGTLRAAGHQVDTAASSAEAFRSASLLPPDLVVVDWMLRNHLTGTEVYLELRRDLPDLKAILITGYGAEDVRAEAEQAEIETIMFKPFSLTEFTAVVDRNAMSTGG